MIYSKNGLHLTEQFESCKLNAYQDQGGVWTIGWGHTRGVTSGLSCLQEQADEWLMEDVGFAAASVDKMVLVPLKQNEFDALVDLAFNLGVENFSRSTMLKLLNAGDYDGAANEFDKWDYVAGKESQGLFRRREAERKEFAGLDPC